MEAGSVGVDANPLLETWTAPGGLPPFERIRPEHFPPALAVAMREHAAEVAAIAADPTPPDFANTVAALERAGRLLARVEMTFSNLVLSLGGPGYEAADRETAPLLAAHALRVRLTPGLFERVDAVHAARDETALAGDERRLLERVHRDFIRSGAALDAAGRARLTAIATELATLQTTFAQNVLHDENAWVLPLAAAELDGLPPALLDALREAARERGLDGHAVTLARSLIEPFLRFQPRRELRQEAHAAWLRRGAHAGAHDNRPLIAAILRLRHERARLLGYADHAAYALSETMAGTPDAVEALLQRVWAPAADRARAEHRRLQAEADAIGMNGAVAAHDWRFLAERVRRAAHALDDAALRPFFALDAIERAAFDVAHRLFGITLEPIADAVLYHPDVRAFSVRHANGEEGGVLLLDHFARPGKRGGAWMSTYRAQEDLDSPVAPVIVNNNNFSRGSPTLLSLDDARTLFHEFGHGLHGLLSRVRFPTQSGTGVLHDFVEFPSQVFEHWLLLPDTLRRFARHHETGEPIDDATIARIRAADAFDQGFATVEFTASAMIDMALHHGAPPDDLDIDAFERAFLARVDMPPAIALRHRPAQFGHLFAGEWYAAGYYAYMWSEVLDADAFEAFTEAGDPFDPALAKGLHAIYAAGDTRAPAELYEAFRGRAPDPGALLRGRALV